MKDRVPANPGRVLITPENGSAAYYATMTRADNPTQEGDPLNKNTLLKDTTAALLGLSADAVPDDAFVKLRASTYTKEETLTSATKTALGLGTNAGPDDAFAKLTQSAFKVGDTLTTARTNLGNKWLLCNGDEVEESDYSELAEMFPTFWGAWTHKSVWSGGNYGYITKMVYVSGYFVAAGLYNDGSTTYARIAYATDPHGTWTIKDLWNSYYADCKGITYVNGYWIVYGMGQDSAGKKCARIAYATNLTGNWTTKDLWNTNDVGNSINDITYANNYWVAVGCYDNNSKDNYYARVAHATKLAGTWTMKDLWSGYGTSNIQAVAYANGYWVVGGSGYSSNRTPRIAYTTNITGTWTTKDLWSGRDGIYNLTYVNGYWVACTYGDSGSRIAYTTKPTGTWTTKDLWGDASSQVRDITYADGYWFAVGRYTTSNVYYARIAYATNLAGDWTIKDIWGEKDSGATVLNSAVYVNGTWFVAGGCLSNNVSHARISSGVTAFTLPTISQDSTYTYIKAKE